MTKWNSGAVRSQEASSGNVRHNLTVDKDKVVHGEVRRLDYADETRAVTVC